MVPEGQEQAYQVLINQSEFFVTIYAKVRLDRAANIEPPHLFPSLELYLLITS